MIPGVIEEQAKRIDTKDLSGRPNGHILELFKDGKKTVAYLSAIAPHAFKGFHFHKVRSARYLCLKGKVKVVLYKDKVRHEHLLEPGSRLFVPRQIVHGMLNLTDEEAWVVNMPVPPYDPELKGEQLDFSEEQLRRGEA
ncbi:MAG: cupin domain-containing protein [Nanoarchaeota archaeon]